MTVNLCAHIRIAIVTNIYSFLYSLQKLFTTNAKCANLFAKNNKKKFDN